MKKAIICPALAVIMYSCAYTKQQKAEKLIKLYLDSSLNDPKSYDPIKFSNIDTSFKKYEVCDPSGIKMNTEKDEYIEKSSNDEKMMEAELKKNDDDYSISRYNKYDVDFKKCQAKIKQIDDYFEEMNKTYKGPINDFKIIHSYRAKNGFGAIGIHSAQFVIDSAFTKVLYADNLDNL